MARKFIFTLSISVIMLCLIAPPSHSARFNQKKSTYVKHFKNHFKNHYKNHYKNRPKDVLHMFLTDANGRWTLTRNAPKGVLKYNLWGEMFDFSFKGIKLSPETSYTLVYYKENDSHYYSFLVLGEGLTDRNGHIYFENTLETCSMPASDDALNVFGARILLVPSYSVDEENGLIDLNRDAELEGSHLIRFFDTDGCILQDTVDEDPVDEAPIVDEDPVDQEPSDEEPDPPVDIPPTPVFEGPY
jgi:hypothetical protein